MSIYLKYFLCADFIWNHLEYFLSFVFQGVSSNSSWEQAMKLIINDPRYRYNAFQRSVNPSYNSKFKLSPSLTYNLLLFNKVHFRSWAKRSRRSMHTKSRQRRKKRRRPELNTKSQKRLFRDSWRTMKRWHLPLDTSKCYCDMAIKYFVFSPLHWFAVLWTVNMIMQTGWVRKHLWRLHTIVQLQHCWLPLKLLWPVSASHVDIAEFVYTITNCYKVKVLHV